MAKMMDALSNTTRIAGRFLADEHGATAIEYAMIASGIGAFIAAAVFGVGTSVMNNLYNKIAAAM
jgi:pilus assembly protein Flp/PilA